jgi:hypothetical protein
VSAFRKPATPIITNTGTVYSWELNENENEKQDTSAAEAKTCNKLKKPMDQI